MESLRLSHDSATPGASRPQGGRPAPRLLTRTLGVTFVTVVTILAVVFLVLTLDLRRRARSEVAEDLEDSRATVSIVDARRSAEFAALGTSLGANPTFTSALQKYRNEMGSFGSAEIRQSLGWVERQLQEMAELLRADVAAAHDVRGLTIAVAGSLGAQWPSQLPEWPDDLRDVPGTLDALVQVDGHPWRVVTLRLRANGASGVTLCIGERLDPRYATSLSTLTRAETVVAAEQRVVATTLDERKANALARAWTDRLPVESGEVELAGERYVFRRLIGTRATAVYGFEALGDQVSKSTASAYRALSVVAAGSLILAWFGSLVLARRLSAPIDRISQSLTAAVASRASQVQLSRDGSSREVDAMTEAFNTLMTSLAHSERETQAAYLGAIRALATALDARDPYTAGHSERVSELSVRMAERMQLSQDAIDVVRLGALLHDIGKIGVDDAVLNKPGNLSAAEQAVIETHPVLGARILEPVSFLAPHLPVVELHHERPDGKGYPHGLTGEEIPLEARIVHVADAYDAMTSNRPYRPARRPEEAIAELLQWRGVQFDAAAVDALVAVVQQPHQSRIDRSLDPGIHQVA